MYDTVFVLLLLGVSLAIHLPKDHLPNVPLSRVASARVEESESVPDKVPNPLKAKAVEEVVLPPPRHMRSHIYGSTTHMSHDAHDRARRAFFADHHLK